MTAPTGTLPDLDEATKQQLQPPCDGGDTWPSGKFELCPKPAEFAQHCHCGCHHFTALLCAEHARPGTTCVECGQVEVIDSSVRL